MVMAERCFFNVKKLLGKEFGDGRCILIRFCSSDVAWYDNLFFTAYIYVAYILSSELSGASLYRGFFRAEPA